MRDFQVVSPDRRVAIACEHHWWTLDWRNSHALVLVMLLIVLVSLFVEHRPTCLYHYNRRLLSHFTSLLCNELYVFRRVVVRVDVLS